MEDKNDRRLLLNFEKFPFPFVIVCLFPYPNLSTRLETMKRKGFNFVVKSTNVETEKVDFNQLTKKPDTSKRDITTTTNNNKRTKKAYYPKSTYQYANDSSNLSHTEKLKIIIDKVSQVESATLKSYFKKLSEETGSSTEIYEHLVNVLETSVQDIRNSCPDDVQFQPEFPSKERKALASSSSETHVNPMETKLSLLTTAYEMLQQYEFDVNEFVASVAPSIESAASADGAEVCNF